MNYCRKSVCHCCISVIIISLNHFELDAFLLSALHAWTKTDHCYNHLIFLRVVGYCLDDILLLGKSPMKWLQRPDMTIAVDRDVTH